MPGEVSINTIKMKRAALKLALVIPLGVPGAAGRIDYRLYQEGKQDRGLASGKKYYHQ